MFAEGYPAWVAYAGKSATERVATAAAIKGGVEEGSIDHAEFRRIIDQTPGSVYLVDVRDADEFKKGSLKTAVNIPVDDLEERIKSLPAGPGPSFLSAARAPAAASLSTWCRMFGRSSNRCITWTVK